jgi:hypothetical protein
MILIINARTHLYLALLLSVAVFIFPARTPIDFWGLIIPASLLVLATFMSAHAVIAFRELTTGEFAASLLLMIFDIVATVYIILVIVDTKAFGDA